MRWNNFAVFLGEPTKEKRRFDYGRGKSASKEIKMAGDDQQYCGILAAG